MTCLTVLYSDYSIVQLCAKMALTGRDVASVQLDTTIDLLAYNMCTNTPAFFSCSLPNDHDIFIYYWMCIMTWPKKLRDFSSI